MYIHMYKSCVSYRLLIKFEFIYVCRQSLSVQIMEYIYKHVPSSCSIILPINIYVFYFFIYRQNKCEPNAQIFILWITKHNTQHTTTNTTGTHTCTHTEQTVIHYIKSPTAIQQQHVDWSGSYKQKNNTPNRVQTHLIHQIQPLSKGHHGFRSNSCQMWRLQSLSVHDTRTLWLH